MTTGSDGGKRIKTLLDFNLVKKWKFDEKQDENDQGSDDRSKMCFVEPPVTLILLTTWALPFQTTVKNSGPEC